MSQVLKSLQLVTQSYNGTPSTGTGALFASGSTLYFENAAGTVFPLGLSGGGGGYLIVREYTGSAPGGGNLTPTWNNNSNIKYIQVICVGGGGGGGCGTNPNLGAGCGGSGGGGGAIAWGFFDSSSLTQASYNIIVGAGGAGGINSSSQAARTGRSGQYTTFGGNMVSASGGSGGTSQVSTTSTNGGAGGLATLCLPGPGFAIPGGNGATADLAANATNATDFFSTPLTSPGTAGGGAGGSTSSAGVRRSGSFGAGGYQYNTLQSNNFVSANSGSSNLVTAAVLLQFTSSIFTTTYGLGGGGNGVTGSGADIATNQVPGGNGGLYGAGGGGSSWRPALGARGGPAFPGGSGSSGLCIVVEYY